MYVCVFLLFEIWKGWIMTTCMLFCKNKKKSGVWHGVVWMLSTLERGANHQPNQKERLRYASGVLLQPWQGCLLRWHAEPFGDGKGRGASLLLLGIRFSPRRLGADKVVVRFGWLVMDRRERWRALQSDTHHLDPSRLVHDLALYRQLLRNYSRC